MNLLKMIKIKLQDIKSWALIMGLMGLLTTKPLNAQRIAMIDIIGTADSVIPAFVKYGLKVKAQDAKSYTLFGKLAGEPATLVFYKTPLSGHIYQVTVTYQKMYASDSVQWAFEERVKKIITRYAIPNSLDLLKNQTVSSIKYQDPTPKTANDPSSSTAATYFKLPDSAVKVSWTDMVYFTNLIMHCYTNAKTHQIVVEYLVKDNLRKLESENAMAPTNTLGF